MKKIKLLSAILGTAQLLAYGITCAILEKKRKSEEDAEMQRRTEMEKMRERTRETIDDSFEQMRRAESYEKRFHYITVYDRSDKRIVTQRQFDDFERAKRIAAMVHKELSERSMDEKYLIIVE